MNLFSWRIDSEWTYFISNPAMLESDGVMYHDTENWRETRNQFSLKRFEGHPHALMRFIMRRNGTDAALDFIHSVLVADINMKFSKLREGDHNEWPGIRTDWPRPSFTDLIAMPVA